jgi:thiol-disulfide isomerase/thioredoxin
VRGEAAYTLALLLAQDANYWTARLDPAAAVRKVKEAEDLLEKVAARYADVWHRQQMTLGTLARKELHGVRHLSVGKEAPDAAGEDLGGKVHRLSDYRGKVVLLNFWSSSCVPCLRLIPHERELVQRLEGKPFVLLGVHPAADVEQLKQVVKKEGVTWPSISQEEFWRWDVHGLPALYLLDGRGVIRARFPGEPGGGLLDQMVERLVREAEASGRRVK